MSEETNVQAATPKKGLPARRSPICYQTQRDIVIPAGTIMRDDDNMGIFVANIGFGDGVLTEFQVEESPAAEACGVFKRVTAA